MDPQLAELFKKANALHKAGKKDEAVEIYDRVLAQAPNFPAALLQKGILLAEMGKGSEAIPFLQRALEAEPSAVPALIWLGRLLRVAGQIDESIAISERLIKLSPKVPYGYNNLGHCAMIQQRFPDAASYFEKCVELDPGVSTFHHTLGLSYRNMGRGSDAIAELRKAIALKPDEAQVCADLADCLVREYKPEEAAMWFRKAYELSPDTIAGQMWRVKGLMEEGQVSDVIEIVTGILERDPDNARSHTILGSMYQAEGDFEKAAEHLKKAMELEPVVKPYAAYVQCKKITEEDRWILDEIHKEVDHLTKKNPAHANYHYALGKAYNDLKEWEPAMREFQQANDLMLLQHASFDRPKFTKITDLLMKTFTPEFFKANRHLGNESTRPIFIVGMIRSGTTLTEQIVCSHPDVGGVGELQYWVRAAEDLATGISLQKADKFLTPKEETVKRWQEEYLAKLEELDPDSPYVTDKQPLNYMSLGLIHLAFPNAKFIHTRRNPVDTMISMYMTPFKNGIAFGHDKDRLVFVYRDYLRLMEHWRSVMPADRFIETDYEVLTEDPEPTTRRVIEFLGLPWDEACLRPEDNDRSVRTPSVWQVRQPVYKTSAKRWKRYEPWLGPFAELLSEEEKAEGEPAA
jgi:tetratricopeptide (TPR) repeat protein